MNDVLNRPLPPTLQDASAWDETQVLDWLDTVGLGQFSDIFKSAAIDGKALMRLGKDPNSVDWKDRIPDEDLRSILSDAVADLSI